MSAIMQYPAVAAPDFGSPLSVGEAVFDRQFMAVASLATISQNLRLCYFSARKTEVTTQVRVGTGTTSAAATPTLCRIGLYEIADDGGGSLVASTVNNTALFASTATAYTVPWSASYVKIAGRRYALGVLVVSAVATPTMVGHALLISTFGQAEYAVAPRLNGLLTGQSDLPSTFTDLSLSSPTGRIYAVLLP